MHLTDLLKFIPSDTEERVRQSRERFNQNVREVLRQETGLRLRRSTRDRVDQTNMFAQSEYQPISADQISVRVELLPGLPLVLRQKAIEDKDRLAALIAPWRRSLEQLRDSAKDVEKLVKLLAADAVGPTLIPTEPESLSTSIRLAERLLQESAVFNLAEWILDVNEDVLGVYRYTLPNPKKPSERRRNDSWIELYWAVIGLVARLLAIEVEDLTVVVLAHELAHAFTHLGTDIDGHCWTSKEFVTSDHALIEGLAQFYANVVCHKLTTVAPKAKTAFALLLKNQPTAYHSHVKWEDESSSEQLRLALLQIRRSGAGKIVQFEGFLQEAKQRLSTTKS
jgi:hypothetical protein